MGYPRQKNKAGFLCALLLAWLLGSAIECAEQRVRGMIFSVSDSRTSIVTSTTDDMTLAYHNSTESNSVFLIEALNALHAESNNLIQKYQSYLTLNEILLNEMANRIPEEQNDDPIVLLYPGEPFTLGGKNTLNCFVSHLFPPVAHVSFLKSDQPLSGQVRSSQFTFDNSWMFQILKYVQIEPAVGDKYSCVVELVTKEQFRAYWEATASDNHKNPVQIAICTVGFVIGALGMMTGLCLIFYKQGNEVGSRDQQTIPAEEPQDSMLNGEGAQDEGTRVDRSDPNQPAEC
ncbi:H-2 class II histocompatibility antigen, A-U alpha chain-like isoform X1 [Carcharodon carcharias]|uniref:H-2 class II histocompatibility antigen, A-U alpha chain-like isoform X1 n=1 Tax=Carcharodon carcharias TaxID=13397 RepID=UPI001B7D99B6|nr:H-2 class II histocompatibility antigen, A-U alpha chain-like isoform X1 [Carcharodon carcharias]